MERKPQSRSNLLTTDVRKVLRSTKALAAEEEKVLRMRLGAGVDPHAPLESAVDGEGDLRDELALLELQLFRGQRQREAKARPAAEGRQESAHRPTRPVSDRTKERIVRALRKKK